MSRHDQFKLDLLRRNLETYNLGGCVCRMEINSEHYPNDKTEFLRLIDERSGWYVFIGDPIYTDDKDVEKRNRGAWSSYGKPRGRVFHLHESEFYIHWVGSGPNMNGAICTPCDFGI